MKSITILFSVLLYMQFLTNCSSITFDQTGYFDEAEQEKISKISLLGQKKNFETDKKPSVLKGSQQSWNYLTVRDNAHMFWWLYYSEAAHWHDVPLILWLQGGPGASGTGFGNFEEIGPLDTKLDHRSTTWLSRANLLFVDNPVGTGYSYVDDISALCRDVDCIAKDLIFLFKQLLVKDLKGFQDVPFYIFSESYGGKMAAVFSKYLYQAQKEGLPIDFRGVAMGDSWIAPVMYVNSWGPYLYTTSLIDKPGYDSLAVAAQRVQEAVNAGNWTNATDLWSAAEDVVESNTNGVNFYNILKWSGSQKLQRPANAPVIDRKSLRSLYRKHVEAYANDDLANLMNGFIRHKLEIIPDNVTWGGQSGDVFTAQADEFMRPEIDTVDYLLTHTNLSVIVYNGQLDLICDTLGTESWVQSLTWPGLPDYFKASRDAMMDAAGVTRAFSRRYKNFSFYWILEAGHMIPQDAGDSALMMLDKIISGH